MVARATRWQGRLIRPRLFLITALTAIASTAALPAQAADMTVTASVPYVVGVSIDASGNARAGGTTIATVTRQHRGGGEIVTVIPTL
jgi:hypothetical protein